ncbi:DUF6343 family protein [Streptomyces phaeoluteigriseus]|uniref:DUF6343 family protein n=1 Tax=Streptomyces phaeoluteigriseus TaxID=114686 RepID=A0ABY4ZBT2_9ACTN|nr:DUF6343 family protein [Streptomyces phaeoluteigriseus]USQ86410.1 DUF6343 family protein [Streptomyces phaeoluteigriseus]
MGTSTPGRHGEERARRTRSGRRFPRTGTEPATARSPLGLRLILSGVFVPVFVVSAVLFAVWAADSGPGDSPGRGPLIVLAVVCGVLAFLAAADLLVVVRRLRRERGSG